MTWQKAPGYSTRKAQAIAENLLEFKMGDLLSFGFWKAINFGG
jgi:hypothetical protein